MKYNKLKIVFIVIILKALFNNVSTLKQSELHGPT